MNFDNRHKLYTKFLKKCQKNEVLPSHLSMEIWTFPVIVNIDLLKVYAIESKETELLPYIIILHSPKFSAWRCKPSKFQTKNYIVKNLGKIFLRNVKFKFKRSNLNY